MAMCMYTHTQVYIGGHVYLHTHTSIGGHVYLHTHTSIYRWLWKGGAVGMAVLIVVVFGIGPLSSAAHDSM